MYLQKCIIQARDTPTPGHTGWDDDTPGKLSSWDLPTPSSGRSSSREDDASSIRSSDWRPRQPSTRRDKYDRYNAGILMDKTMDDKLLLYPMMTKKLPQCIKINLWKPTNKIKQL